MELLRDQEHIESSRTLLLDYLNQNGLDGESILSISRQSVAYFCEPDEAIILQGKEQQCVYFLVTGGVAVYAQIEGEYRELGERDSVCVLGEISFFTGSLPTADVIVRGPEPGIVFRLDFDRLGEIIRDHPQVREMLNRIGEMRLIAQHNGFANFPGFMELIGHKRQRYLLDQRVAPLLDDLVREKLVPLIQDGKTLLEVGDGPGILSEMAVDHAPDAQERLHVQSTHMEQAVADPFTPLPSDLSRAKFLRRGFDGLVALQVFNTVPAERVMEQFRIARGLIHPGGILMLVKARVVNVNYAVGSSETHLFFELLRDLVDEAWPGLRGEEQLIQTVFLDADFDALMSWNQALIDQAGRKQLEIPPNMEGVSRTMLELLLEQARRAIFNPDAIHFAWLSEKARGMGFTLTDSEHDPDLGYYFQLYTRE